VHRGECAWERQAQQRAAGVADIVRYPLVRDLSVAREAKSYNIRVEARVLAARRQLLRFECRGIRGGDDAATEFVEVLCSILLTVAEACKVKRARCVAERVNPVVPAEEPKGSCRGGNCRRRKENRGRLWGLQQLLCGRCKYAVVGYNKAVAHASRCCSSESGGR